jgi:hypothetical protein
MDMDREGRKTLKALDSEVESQKFKTKIAFTELKDARTDL